MGDVVQWQGLDVLDDTFDRTALFLLSLLSLLLFP